MCWGKKGFSWWGGLGAIGSLLSPKRGEESPKRTLFMWPLRYTLCHAVWDPCRVVEYCSLYIVDLKTEARVTCVGVVVAF